MPQRGGQDGHRQPVLVGLGIQQGGLFAVGQEAALHQDGGDLRLLQQVDPAARRLDALGPVVDRLVQGGLDGLRQLQTAHGLAVEDLRAVDAGDLGQAVLMQAHQHAAGDAVDLSHPVLQIGVLPLPDRRRRIALRGHVLPAGHVGADAQQAGDLLHLQGHL